MCIKKEEKKFFEMEPGLITHSLPFFEGFNRRCSFSYNSFSNRFPSIAKKIVEDNKLIKISNILSVKQHGNVITFLYFKKD